MPRDRAFVTVARWELWRVLRRPDFFLSVILTPLLVIAAATVADWVGSLNRTKERSLVIVWRPADFAAPERSGATARPAVPVPSGFRWVEPEAGTWTEDEARSRILAGSLDGAIVLDTDFADGGTATLILRRHSSRTAGEIRDHLTAVARTLRANAMGLGSGGLERLDAPIDLETTVADPRLGTSGMDRFAAVMIPLLVAFAVFVTGSYLFVGVAGEKQARVTEVVLSSISAQAWMDGKIAAYSAIGFTMMLLWGGAASFFSVAFLHGVPPSFHLGLLALYGLFGALGFIAYVAVFAAIMAMMKDLHSASNWQGFAFFLPFLPVFFLKTILDAPDSVAAALLSMIPFLSSMLMPMRLALGAAPPWQVGISLLLLGGCAWLLRRAAGTVFRLGMLLYGKNVTVPEALAALRHDE